MIGLGYNQPPSACFLVYLPRRPLSLLKRTAFFVQFPWTGYGTLSRFARTGFSPSDKASCAFPALWKVTSGVVVMPSPAGENQYTNPRKMLCGPLIFLNNCKVRFSTIRVDGRFYTHTIRGLLLLKRAESKREKYVSSSTSRAKDSFVL